MKIQWVRGSVALAALCLGSATLAGDLVVDGTITRVTNTSNNQVNFSVKVVGGSTNICSGMITFPLSLAADPDAHKRAYAAALFAMAMALPVRIYNYNNDNCSQASYIEVRS